MDLLTDTSGGPNVLKVRGAAIARRSRAATPARSPSTSTDGLKDLRAMLAEGKARGLAMPLVKTRSPATRR